MDTGIMEINNSEVLLEEEIELLKNEKVINHLAEFFKSHKVYIKINYLFIFKI